MIDRRYFFGDAQFGAAGAGVNGDFFDIGLNRFPCDEFERRLWVAVEVFFHFAGQIPRAHEVLHKPVFQGVVGDDDQPSAILQRVERLREERLEDGHLLVDLDADGLENFGKALVLLAPYQGRFQCLDQLSGGGDGLFLAGLEDAAG